MKNPDAYKTLDLFLDSLRSYNLSKNSVLAYQNDLHQFFLITKKEGLSWNSLDREGFSQYLGELHSLNFTATTIQRKLSSVRRFLNYAEKNMGIKNPAKTFTAPRRKPPLPKPIRLTDLETLLDFSDTPWPKRDKALWEIIYSAGLRISEALSLNVDQIGRNSVVDRLVISGKGGKERVIFLGEVAQISLRLYLNERNDKNPKVSSLFINRYGSSLSRRGAHGIFKIVLQRAGLPIDYSLHSLRHSFATDLLDEGADLRHIQEMLGHASLSTTQVYTHVAKAKVKKVYWESHPHAKK